MPTVDINFITAIGRVRTISEAKVAALANSIADVGLLNPITVYVKSIIRSGSTVDGYGLIAGAHRLEACKRLGWAEIPVYVVDMDELHRTIAECDENLCGTNLDAVERAEFTFRRKLAYEALYPETAKGNPGVGRQVGDTRERASTSRFTKETAGRTGVSERKVQRDAERGENITEGAFKLIKGSRLANNGRYLDQLKNTPAEDQVKQVRADLAAPVPEHKRAPVVRLVETDISPLMREWSVASERERDELRAIILAEARPALSVERLN